jgi:hypothetical protein
MPEPAYWRLIAILRSTLPLAGPLAMRLYQAARDLHARQAGVERLTGDLAMGEVRRLGKVQPLGSLSGPAFEADLDTPSGSGQVRFIVTQEGLEEPTAGSPAHETPGPARLPN